MNGPFRQVHHGVHSWVREGPGHFEAYLTVANLTWSPLDIEGEYAFVVVDRGDLYAFCLIADATEDGTVSEADKLQPWRCNEWLVFDPSPEAANAHPEDSPLMGSQWRPDPMMDVDECAPDGPDDRFHDVIPNNTVYDELLCFAPSGGWSEYSHYQGLFGLFELNGDYMDRESFDGRPFYNAPRLDDVRDGQWHILWFDEHDSWVINDYIPHNTVQEGGHVFFYESYCDHCTQPSECTKTWPLYEGYENIEAEDSDVVITVVAEGSASAANCMAEPDDDTEEYTSSITLCFDDGLNAEADCMAEPDDDTEEYTNSITLCFDDGLNAEADNKLSGKYVLQDNEYNGRRVWLQDQTDDDQDAHFLFYDSPKRFWVLDATLGDKSYFTSPDFEAYCLLWDEFEPFGCGTWYFYNVTIGDEIPSPGEFLHRETMVLTMTAGGSCSGGSSEEMNVAGAASVGAVVGYVVLVLVLLCLLVLIVMGCRKRGQFSFMGSRQESGLAKMATGGIASRGAQSSLDAVEMGPATTGRDALPHGAVRATSVSMSDGSPLDGNMTTKGGD